MYIRCIVVLWLSSCYQVAVRLLSSCRQTILKLLLMLLLRLLLLWLLFFVLVFLVLVVFISFFVVLLGLYCVALEADGSVLPIRDSGKQETCK